MQNLVFSRIYTCDMSLNKRPGGLFLLNPDTYMLFQVESEYSHVFLHSKVTSYLWRSLFAFMMYLVFTHSIFWMAADLHYGVW